MAGRRSGTPVSKEELVARVYALRDKAAREGKIPTDNGSEESSAVKRQAGKSTPIPKNLPRLPYRRDIDG